LARKYAPQIGRDRLDEPMAALIQNQATFFKINTAISLTRKQTGRATGGDPYSPRERLLK
jgi:hypothetical protein